MNEEKDIKQKILRRAEDIFKLHGFSKVTMEEIASDLGISKKTLYKHFSNKEHLLKEIVSLNKCETADFIDKLLKDTSIPFIQKLERFMDFIAQLSTKLENPMTAELMRCRPEVWKDIDDFRTKHAYKNLSSLIQQGITDGAFRSDLNTDIVVVTYVAAVHSAINPTTLSKLPVSGKQAYKEIIKILFEGIFTSEGRKKYKSSLKEYYEEVHV